MIQKEEDYIWGKKEFISLTKSPYLAEYIGFVQNDVSDPYFGSIVTRLYPYGNLNYFVRSKYNF